MPQTDWNPGHRILPLLLGIALWSGTIQAEPKAQDASLKEVLRKAQGVMRQLNEDKARLETEKTALLGEKAELQQHISRLEARVHTLELVPAALERCQAGSEAAQKLNSGLQAQIDAAHENATQLKRQHHTLTEQSRALQADNQWLVDAVKEREQWIEHCTDNNRRMLELSQKQVQQHREKNLWQRMGDFEPLTGIGAVNTENAAESYRYQLHQLKVTPYESSPQPTEPPR